MRIAGRRGGPRLPERQRFPLRWRPYAAVRWRELFPAIYERFRVARDLRGPRGPRVRRRPSFPRSGPARPLLRSLQMGFQMEKLLERPLSALDAIYTRRSVRSYTSQPIDPSTVRALLDAAVQAPTAMLEQPWAFVVVQDPGVLRRLSDRAKAMWMGETALPPELNFETEPGVHRNFVERVADP